MNNVGAYIILESANFYNLIDIKVNQILENTKFREQFNYLNDNYLIEVFDNFEELLDKEEKFKEEDLEYHISIEITDDGYSYNGVDNRACSVFFTLQEKFKQYNFEDKKVYSIFEVISTGYSPSDKARDYKALSEGILLRMCE